jgi:hypothetical protein
MQRQTLRNLGDTNVCRSVEPSGVDHAAADHAAKECGTVVGILPPPANYRISKKPSSQKRTASFTDTLPASMQQANPAGFAGYTVEVLNTDKRGAGLSNQARVPLVPTVPPFSPFEAEVMRLGVMISWRCPRVPHGTAGVKYLFRIYRHSAGNAVTTKIAELDATECVAGPGTVARPEGLPSSAPTAKRITSFLDENIEWESRYFYYGTVVSVIAAAGKAPVEVEGDDTPEVKVFAHDIFPPAVPTGLQAVFSGPGQPPFIDLIWAPVADPDLAGYNVYRHQEGALAIKLNTDLVQTPAFRDTQVFAGKTYFYSVSAEDRQGNESAHSPEASERVP